MKAVLDRRRKEPRVRHIGGRAITRIVVPVDFSRTSAKAISYALEISRRFNTDLHFVHVIDGSQYLPPTTLMWKATTRSFWRKHIYKKMARLADKYTWPGDRFTLHIAAEERADKAICRRAKELNADLIVIATHGRTGYRRVLLGSTAEGVVRLSPCPVLIVRPAHPRRSSMADDGRERGLPIRRIVIPIDFSVPSQSAFELGSAIANDLGAAVVLVHVAPHPWPVGGVPSGFAMMSLLKADEENAYEKMRDMAERAGLTGSVEIARGSPATMICERASHEDADLIVISTHGRTGIRHAVMGGVAEHVVRHADCPVLVVPAHWADFTHLNQ